MPDHHSYPMIPRELAMDSATPNPPTDDFLGSAAALLVKSSNSINDRLREELPSLFPPQTLPSAMNYETMAFLTSIVLHQAQARLQAIKKPDLNQTFHALKDGLAQAGSFDPSLFTDAKHFDDQTFHDLVACYFKGALDGFEFSDQEIENTARETGLPIPQAPGIEAIFLALLIRLIRLSTITAISETAERKKSIASLTRLTETSLSSFALALQLLR